ncbi:MAG: biotin--[acetyl-CoA-carboxylase] ligase, partial [Pseudomonadales bacterium]
MVTQDLDPLTLTRRLGPLLEAGEAPLETLGLDPATLRGLGFDVQGGAARIPADLERLDAAGIRARLDERASDWLRDLEVLEVTGSTSALLNEMAGRRSVEGVVRLAELQVQGRGRRGRSWASPYASNLALSLGARLPQTPDLLGGFSLCVGLAVADRLSTAGVPDIELKWPNDVLAQGRKIAGILIDLHRADPGSEVVVGIGLNF